MNQKLKLEFEMKNFFINKEEEMDSRFVHAEIEAFATGANCHTLPITFEVLENSAETIYDVPITYSYNNYLQDYEGHEITQVPLGFVKDDRVNNPLRLEQSADGRVFLKIKGTIWKHYGGSFLEVFSKSNNQKSVSVELAVTDGAELPDGKFLVRDFVYHAITILGSHVTPAVKDANIALQFSQDTQEYLNQLDSKTKSEVAMAETVSLDNASDNLGKEENVNEIQCEDSDTVSKGDDKMSKQANKVENKDDDKEKDVALAKGEDDTNSVKAKEDDKEKETSTEDKGDDTDTSEKAKMEDDEENEDKEKEEDVDMAKSTYPNKDSSKNFDEASVYGFQALQSNFEELQEEHNQLKAKFSEMSDYAELKKFQKDTLEKQAIEQDMANMQHTFDALEAKGVSFSEADLETIKSERTNFATFALWDNFVKAQAFEGITHIDGDEGVVKFALNTTIEKTEVDESDIWGKAQIAYSN